MSPELIDPEMFGLKGSCPTQESDCYALGMVIYEVLSGQTPFAPCKGAIVIQKVLGGERPERPQGSDGKLFTDDVWRIVQLCWKSHPSERTSAKDVYLDLGGNPFSNVGGDVETDGEDQPDTAASNKYIPPFHPRLIFDSPCITIGPPINIVAVTTNSPLYYEWLVQMRDSWCTPGRCSKLPPKSPTGLNIPDDTWDTPCTSSLCTTYGLLFS
jgi:hypothetical protein